LSTAQASERWPAASQVINETYGRLLDVCKELEIIRAEKAIADSNAKRDFIDDLTFNLGLPMKPVLRRKCMKRFTLRMMRMGELIYDEQEDDSPLWD
jgi:hypothetical protein